MYTVAKRHKRLHIIDEVGTSIYTPPDFIKNRGNNKEKLVEMARKLNEDPQIEPIVLIMGFEFEQNRK